MGLISFVLEPCPVSFQYTTILSLIFSYYLYNTILEHLLIGVLKLTALTLLFSGYRSLIDIYVVYSFLFGPFR